jgi:hypothetical protein
MGFFAIWIWIKKLNETNVGFRKFARTLDYQFGL